MRSVPRQRWRLPLFSSRLSRLLNQWSLLRGRIHRSTIMRR
ncbi:MAG TPA: hypothetical protein VM032_11270 [Vicinamibacterales bacterium]|nr:hypothetical protein [Vicinamibacterales bacterium]